MNLNNVNVDSISPSELLDMIFDSETPVPTATVTTAPESNASYLAIKAQTIDKIKSDSSSEASNPVTKTQARSETENLPSCLNADAPEWKLPCLSNLSYPPSEASHPTIKMQARSETENFTYGRNLGNGKRKATNSTTPVPKKHCHSSSHTSSSDGMVSNTSALRPSYSHANAHRPQHTKTNAHGQHNAHGNALRQHHARWHAWFAHRYAYAIALRGHENVLYEHYHAHANAHRTHENAHPNAHRPHTQTNGYQPFHANTNTNANVHSLYSADANALWQANLHRHANAQRAHPSVHPNVHLNAHPNAHGRYHAHANAHNTHENAHPNAHRPLTQTNIHNPHRIKTNANTNAALVKAQCLHHTRPSASTKEHVSHIMAQKPAARDQSHRTDSNVYFHSLAQPNAVNKY